MVSPGQSIYAYNVLMERLDSQCIKGPKLAPFADICHSLGTASAV